MVHEEMEDKQMMEDVQSLKKQLRKNLFKTYQGWMEWVKIKRKLTPKTAVIFLPQDHTKDNYYALLYLDKFLEKHQYENAWILTSDPVVVKVSGLFSENISKVVYISEKAKSNILQFACLYHFAPRFYIASLTVPYGRHADRLIGINQISYAEIFSVGVYQMDKFYQVKGPKYIGNDEEIKKFLNQV